MALAGQSFSQVAHPRQHNLHRLGFSSSVEINMTTIGVNKILAFSYHTHKEDIIRTAACPCAGVAVRALASIGVPQSQCQH